MVLWRRARYRRLSPNEQQMIRNPKTPQQKKRESYAKDRRNTYGENAKSSRKAIPRRKALRLRALRRIARAAIEDATAHADLDRIEEVEPKLKLKRLREWRKVPDQPLGKVLARKATKRMHVKERKNTG